MSKPEGLERKNKPCQTAEPQDTNFTRWKKEEFLIIIKT